jgi:chemotaxis protein CheC
VGQPVIGQREQGETMPDARALWTTPEVSHVDTVRRAFADGLARSARSLSAMVGAEIRAVEAQISLLSLPEALALAGAPDRATMAIHLGLNGKLNAHLVLLFGPEDAQNLVQLLLPPGRVGPSERALLEESALGEVGNVVGSSFAIVLGDLIGSPLWSSTPTVQVDMAAALLDGIIACASGDRERVLVVAARFAEFEVASHHSVRGTFLVVPEVECVATLLHALDQRAGAGERG